MIRITKKVWQSKQWKEASVTERGLWISLVAQASVMSHLGVVLKTHKLYKEHIDAAMGLTAPRLLRIVGRGIQVNMFPELERDFSAQAQAIFKEYPKKLAKQEAVRAINKALDDFSFEHLLERTKVYASHRKGQEMAFTPYAATWFNQQRFEEDEQMWAAPEKPTTPDTTFNL